MKWVIRILAIAGVVFCGCGFALAGIGYASGGGDYIRAVDLADIKEVFLADIKDGLGKISGNGASNMKIETGDVQNNGASIVQKGKEEAVSGGFSGIHTWEADDIKLNSVTRI